MKHKRSLCNVVLWLLLLMPQLLSAQRNDAFLKMKPGDWFEVKMDISGKRGKISEASDYQMRYQLKKVLPLGGREYRMVFERIRMKWALPDQMLGYDSRYPPYLQSNAQPPVKPAFQLQVDRSGKTVSIIPEREFPEVLLTPTRYSSRYGSSSAERNPMPTENAKLASEFAVSHISRQAEQVFSGKRINSQDTAMLLSAASFPLVKNTLIRGRISNYEPGIGRQLSLYRPGSDGSIEIAADGSFNIPFLLTEAAEVTLIYEQQPKNYRVSFFVQPGDTLTIHTDGNHFAEGLQFEGKNTAVAELAAELGRLRLKLINPEIKYGAKSFSAADFMAQQEKDKASFDALLNAYNGRIPEEAWEFYHNKFVFGQADARLNFLSKTKNRSTPEMTEVFEGFPKDFFKSIDTLPIQMLDGPGFSDYESFLHNFGMYLSNRIEMVSGWQYGFLAGYSMSLTYLKRFPLYFALAEGFEHELEDNDWKHAQGLKPYYDDFINNCGDTSLTKTVREKWELTSRWAPGNPSPLSALKLADGSVLDLNKFKGKALSLTFNFHYPDEIKHLIGRIRKQDPDKVHFVIAQSVVDGFPKSTIDSLLKGLPNVTYVEVPEYDDERDKLVLLHTFDIKTFIFDGGLRVIADNLDDKYERPDDNVFKEALKQALEPRRMDPEKKAQLIRIIGWSVCSILVSFLTGLWIYRVRMRGLKRKEAVRRQIKELEIKAIRSQMNPHFLFNALNSIQSLINNNQYKEASIYLEKFALLMRKVLNNSGKPFVSLSDELEAVRLYAELEMLRFDFMFNLDISPDIEPDLMEIPGMIIQPLVENAIVHGLAKKGRTGMLNVSVALSGASLQIIVKDNGPGLHHTDSKHEGFGLNLVRERLDLLNRRAELSNSNEGKLTLSSNLAPDECGVTAVLTIPVD